MKKIEKTDEELELETLEGEDDYVKRHLEEAETAEEAEESESEREAEAEEEESESECEPEARAKGQGYDMLNYKLMPHSKILVKRQTTDAINPSIDKFRCTILGGTCQQAFTAFFQWERVLGAEFGFEIKNMIEIGTGWGNTALYFLLWSFRLGASFHTFDHARARAHQNTRAKRMLDLPSHVHYGDVFEPKSLKLINSLINQPGQSLVFCDGGDKVHEFRTFAPMLKPDDILAVHDYPRAWDFEHCEETIENEGLELFDFDTTEELSTCTVFFMKRRK